MTIISALHAEAVVIPLHLYSLLPLLCLLWGAATVLTGRPGGLMLLSAQVTQDEYDAICCW